MPLLVDKTKKKMVIVISPLNYPFYAQQTLLRKFILRWFEYLIEGVHLISDHIQCKFIHRNKSGSGTDTRIVFPRWVTQIPRSSSLTLKAVLSVETFGSEMSSGMI